MTGVLLALGLLALPSPAVAFEDVEGSVHATSIETLVQVAVTAGCDDGERYCPADPVRRDQMATFLQRALQLEPVAPAFDDVEEGTTHAGAIGAIAQRAITQGCGDGLYCPRQSVTRGQMATFLARAFELEPGTGTRFDDVDDDHPHATGIGAVAAADISVGCRGGDAFCPEQPVRRDQMASFLTRALRLYEPVPCPGVPTDPGVRSLGTAAPGYPVTGALPTDRGLLLFPNDLGETARITRLVGDQVAETLPVPAGTRTWAVTETQAGVFHGQVGVPGGAANLFRLGDQDGVAVPARGEFWTLTGDDEGRVYAGTRAWRGLDDTATNLVHRYDPATGELEELVFDLPADRHAARGRVAQEDVKQLVWDADVLVTGTGFGPGTAHLLLVDLAGPAEHSPDDPDEGGDGGDPEPSPDDPDEGDPAPEDPNDGGDGGGDPEPSPDDPDDGGDGDPAPEDPNDGGEGGDPEPSPDDPDDGGDGDPAPDPNEGDGDDATRNLVASDITPASIVDARTVFSLAVTDDWIALGTWAGGGDEDPDARLVVLDRDDPTGAPAVDVTLPDETRVDQLAIEGDRVAGVAFPSGSVYVADASTGLVTDRPAPVRRSATRSLELEGDELRGVAAPGRVWTMDVTTGARTSYLNLAVLGGVPHGRQTTHSLGTSQHHALVGTNGEVHLHPLRDAERTSRIIPGETKAIATDGDAAYLATYPGAQVWRLTGEGGLLSSAAGRIADLDPRFNRPRDVAVDPDTGRVAVVAREDGTDQPRPSQLAVIDPDAAEPVVDEVPVHRIGDPDKPVEALRVAAGDGLAVVGDREGGVRAFDLAGEEVEMLWELRPRLVNRAVVSLERRGDVVLGVLGDDGGWFELHAESGAVLRIGRGDMVAGTSGANDAATLGPVTVLAKNRDLVALEREQDRSVRLLRHVRGETFTGPLVAASDDCDLHLIIDRDLARLPYDPRTRLER